jgi:hypothetical protein
VHVLADTAGIAGSTLQRSVPGSYTAAVPSVCAPVDPPNT